MDYIHRCVFLGGTVTESPTITDQCGLSRRPSCSPWDDVRSPSGDTIFILQNGRDLGIMCGGMWTQCHLATCDDLTLMEGFWCGLEDDIRFVMPRAAVLVVKKLHQFRTVDRRIGFHRGRSGVQPMVITCGRHSAVRDPPAVRRSSSSE